MKKFAAFLLTLIIAAALAVSVSANRDNTTVNAARFTKAPVIDGVITTEEWGEPTSYAKVFIGRRDFQYDDEENIICSPYCYMGDGRLAYTNDCSFDLWLRWDDEYFYIGVVSKDKYGLATASYLNEDNPEYIYSPVWDGDALQFGIDPAGANSTGNPSQPYEQFSRYTYVFGYLDETFSRIVLRNDANMAVEVEGYKGNIKWSDGVWPSFCGEANTEAGYLTYEVAVPYSAFDGSIAAGKKDGFGVTVARVSGTPTGSLNDSGEEVGQKMYECWLSWGDGVMGSLKDQLPEFRCGSNSVILVDTPAVGSGAVEAPAPVTQAETSGSEDDETTAAEDDVTTAESDETTADADEADVTTIAEDVQTTAPEADETTLPETTNDDGNVKENDAKNNSVIWIVIAVAAVIVVIGIIVAVAKKKNTGKDAK